MDLSSPRWELLKTISSLCLYSLLRVYLSVYRGKVNELLRPSNCSSVN